MRSTVSSTSPPMARSSSTVASGSASATSTSVRMIVSGLRSSCPALATKRSRAANASAADASSRPASAQPSVVATSVAPRSAIRYCVPSCASAASASGAGRVRSRWRPINQYDAAIRIATKTTNSPP